MERERSVEWREREKRDGTVKGEEGRMGETRVKWEWRMNGETGTRDMASGGSHIS